MIRDCELSIHACQPETEGSEVIEISNCNHVAGRSYSTKFGILLFNNLWLTSLPSRSPAAPACRWRRWVRSWTARGCGTTWWPGWPSGRLRLRFVYYKYNSLAVKIQTLSQIFKCETILSQRLRLGLRFVRSVHFYNFLKISVFNVPIIPIPIPKKKYLLNPKDSL